VSTKTGAFANAAHWMLQAPFRHKGRGFGDFDKCHQLGRLVARQQGRQFTHDMIRQILSLALIRHHADVDSEGSCNMVIGDGYGVMTALNLLASPGRQIIAVNLIRPLLLDLIFSSRVVPGLRFSLVTDEDGLATALELPEIRLIAVKADDALLLTQAPIGLAINIHSMQEMDMAVIAEYFRVLRTNKAARTLFYSCNKNLKTLLDGSEIRFDDYPWHPEDEIGYDGISPWSQLNYSKTPPFWHPRRGGEWATRHRLAFLHREAA
jgi:hypothetical protein